MEWRLTLGDIARATGGMLWYADSDEIVKDVITDSRKIIEGSVFIALKGENFDGHRFVASAVEQGAVCAVVEHWDAEDGTYPVIVVDDTYKALRDIAKLYRRQFDIPIVAITGSVGKTSTKDMIYSVLSSRFNAFKTIGNFNNEIGLPLTVFKMTSENMIGVLEMGMSNFGEISKLSDIVNPDLAVITNIGISHIENLKSQENILKAKLEILDGMQEGGTIILNGDDPFLWGLRGMIPYETLYYGIKNEECELVARNIKGFSDSTFFEFELDGEINKVEIKVPGVHHVYNALAAILVGFQYGLNAKEIIDGVAGFVPGGMRQNIIRTEKYTIIKDCYNASPVSMRSGLNVLGVVEPKVKGARKIAILGNMLELGEFAVESHKNVGKWVKEENIDCLIAVGDMAKYIAVGAMEAGFEKDRIFWFKTNAEVICALGRILEDGDCILIKGSRGARLEEVADTLYEDIITEE
ncbi:MAG: UDP-N-acetylmuramoyl-tripeptide--D-alanyl-D-alanine ligase [Ruminococcaceae bacterium]|nr:UDP-N-acetylmuramoyl-tripeptide--D-alanyl-D-alanine ligase [Oscillospiraceae bacterium]